VLTLAPPDPADIPIESWISDNGVVVAELLRPVDGCCTQKPDRLAWLQVADPARAPGAGR
jgi:hypothetical protein